MVLTLEPDNPHDKNAIKIEDQAGKRIAYVPAEIAAVLVKVLRPRKFPYKAFVTTVQDGDLTVWGVKLDLYKFQET